MRNIVIEMMTARHYKLSSLESLDISEFSFPGIKQPQSSENSDEEPVARETARGCTAEIWTWEQWAKEFEFDKDPYEIMDGYEYSSHRLRMALTCKDQNDDQVVVFWYPESKLGKEKASSLLRKLDEYKTIILIHNSKISADAKTNFCNLPETKHLEIFFDGELYINVLKHPYVPPHKILSQTEADRILKKYAVVIKKGEYPGMPLILATDPIAKFLSARQGQVIEITRPSYTQILPDGKKATIPSYRYVVASPNQ
jgi:DNA-directed RNA polymerase I, II, and III subunit RPABC1